MYVISGQTPFWRVWIVSSNVPVVACLLLGLWLAPANASPVRVTGTGFVADEGHPKHPGDFTRYDCLVRVTYDPVPGEAVVAFGFDSTDTEVVKNRYRYHIRRGRLFQVDDKGAEILPASAGDIQAAAVAAI